MAGKFTLVEVGPRDGLQNEAGFIPTAAKLELIAALAEAGFTRIEATAFVAPKWVPQMADHEAVLHALAPHPGLRYSVLVPNLRGAEVALAVGAGELAVFTAASESFCQKNINASIAESLTRFAPVIELASKSSVPVRGYVSCVTHCPYEGVIAPEAVAQVARALLDLGCYEVALGETLGRAEPADIAAMLDAVLPEVPATKLAGHFHDTGGCALTNVEVAWARGVTVFDGSVAGLGGCPYAPGASGNLASEALVAFFEDRGIATGIDREKLATAAGLAQAMRQASR
jgi:hydroxymethylglutaryl-CoA lyase